MTWDRKQRAKARLMLADTQKELNEAQIVASAFQQAADAKAVDVARIQNRITALEKGLHGNA